MPKTKVSTSGTSSTSALKSKKTTKSTKSKKVKESVVETPVVTKVAVETEVPVEPEVSVEPSVEPEVPVESELLGTPEINESVTEVEPVVPVLSKEMEVNAEIVSDKKTTRRVVNKDSIRQNWDDLFVTYENELKQCKKQPHQKQNLLKSLQQLRMDTYRLLRIRNRSTDGKGRSSNSGFNKPVKVTPDLARFINVEPNEEVTRVLITQKLCSYVKEKELQNPEDRREILPDEELKKLFDVNDANKDQKLTYYSMQRRIQPHIIKI
jgi:chromatin remodeling complex protein RSC6